MVLSNATPKSHIERRLYRRYSVDCPARLKLVDGDRTGSLSDLSESGARFETPQPPIEGASGLLVWAGQEHGCTVIWASEGRCGVRFDRPIPKGVVDSCVVPAFGQKRTAP